MRWTSEERNKAAPATTEEDGRRGAEGSRIPKSGLAGHPGSGVAGSGESLATNSTTCDYSTTSTSRWVSNF